MFRQLPQTARLSTRAAQPSRTYTSGTTPPSANRTGAILAVTAVTALAGGYWYMYNQDEAAALHAKASNEQAEIERKARELGDVGKARAETLNRQLQTSVDGKVQSAEAWGRQVGDDAQKKYDEFKSSTEKSANDARREAKYDRSKKAAQKSVDDARQSTENLYNEARSEAEKKKEEAKAGWFSWLGWGKSKAADAGTEAEQEAKRIKGGLEKS